VKKACPSPKPETQAQEREASGKLLVFCDGRTGSIQFQARLNEGESLSSDRIAGLVAMQCLVRGQAPEDFLVLVGLEDGSVTELQSRATGLLNTSRTIASPAPLSPRQQDVLKAVLLRQANKEIASRLNISERTVKFHVSALLSKFRVRSRLELARRAAVAWDPTGVLSVNASRPAKSKISQHFVGLQAQPPVGAEKEPLRVRRYTASA
jgi:DNA-binding CsgD family transcriptional regulator